MGQSGNGLLACMLEQGSGPIRQRFARVHAGTGPPTARVSAVENGKHSFARFSRGPVSVAVPLGEGMPMAAPASARLFVSFTPVSDPRSSQARPRLCERFGMALGAVLSGAEGGEDREEYGPAQAAWFQQFLALPHGRVSPMRLPWTLRSVCCNRTLPCGRIVALSRGRKRWSERGMARGGSSIWQLSPA